MLKENRLNSKNNDLCELLVDISNFNLEYRDSLNLDKRVTFGVEIEYERMIKLFTDFYVKRNLKGWISKCDESLVLGGEVTSPICIDEKDTWVNLKKICSFLKKRKVITDDNAGGHVHVGAHIIKDYHSFRKFLKTYALYENILLRFLFGQSVSPRKTFLEYSFPISPYILKNINRINECQSMEDIQSFLPYYRFGAINFSNIKDNMHDIKNKNTIEFRSPNGSVDEVIWQNNINTLTKFLLSVNDSNYDEEFLDYKLKNHRLSHLYGVVNLRDALEFCDLVFNKEIDKYYFLRQYIKDFDDTLFMDKSVKTKKFTK